MKRLFFAFLSCFFLLPAVSFAAECVIVEYEALADDAGHRLIPLPREPNLAVQAVTYTVSASSAVFDERTTFVRIKCDALAYYKFSTTTEDTEATATDASIAQDTTVDLGVPAGQDYKVEFYDGSS